MYSIFTLLICFSATFAYQFNINFGGIFSNRFYTAAIFGDSTSDTGNVYDLTAGTWPIVPPYYEGRYCNYFNWADDLNVLFKLNYAYGSATTDSGLVQGLAKLNTVPVPGILQQVTQYLQAPPLLFAPSSTVCILWGGANDLIFNQTLARYPEAIVTSLMNSVIALLAAGVKNIIVFNQEPFQAVPFASLQNQHQLFVELTAAINIGINSSLKALQAVNPQASLYLFELYTIINDQLANPPSPVTDIVNYCWIDYNLTAVLQICSNANTYFFVDTFHFSAPVQQQLANAVNQFFYYGFQPNSASSYFYSY